MAEPGKPEEEKPTDPNAPVIDLEAEDVTEAGPSSDPAPQTAARPKRKSSWRSWATAATAVLLLFIGAWAYKHYGQGLWPSDAITAMAARINTLEAENKTLNNQLSGLGATLDQVKSETAGLTQTIETLRSSSDSAVATGASARQAADAVKAQLAAAEQRIAAIQKSVDALKSAPSGAGANAPSLADTTALATLSTRVEALEKDVAALKAKGPSPDTQSATVLSQLMADLKAKLAAGAPYQDELKRIAEIVPAAPGLETLQGSAATGLATAAMLAEEAKGLSASLPTPQSEPAEAASQSYWDSFSSLLSSVVKVRRIDQTDWRDAAAAAANFASEGDLKQAIKYIDESEGDVPQALGQWRDKAKARLAADVAIDDVQAAVLRQISALGGTQ